MRWISSAMWSEAPAMGARAAAGRVVTLVAALLLTVVPAWGLPVPADDPFAMPRRAIRRPVRTTLHQLS